MIFLRLLWQIPIALLLLTIVFVFANEYAIARSSRREKNIAYVSSDQPGFDAEQHVLDVYIPKESSAKLRPVVVFIHGGSWDSGSKNLYSFIGRRLAKQGIVAVLINYRLAPGVQVPDMVDDCAQAVVWTTKHSAKYGGDPNRIFLMGHSAGGGIAALLATDNQYLANRGLTQSPIKGTILDDPAGLDMYDYLQKMEYPNDERYLIPFGKKQEVWRAMSALYHVNAGCQPMLIYVGERTYPSIVRSTRKFNQRLLELGINHEFAVMPGKKHIEMVTQLFWQKNVIYKDLQKLVAADSLQ
jgi:acetyl esterase/lipase